VEFFTESAVKDGDKALSSAQAVAEVRTGNGLCPQLPVLLLLWLRGGLCSCACQGVRLTKDLVNGPPNYIKPQALADTAKAIAEVREPSSATGLMPLA
jgi:hypothetical protein